jgi:NAD+ synthase
MEETKMQTQINHILTWIKNYFINEGNENTKAVIGISGGKDSTVAAALLCRALGPKRVVAVMMPQGEQKDIDDAYDVCDYLRIPEENRYEIDISSTVNALYKATYLDGLPPVVTTNTPARIRMTTLYLVAGLVGGRVCNTGNRSELYVGYTTKYGDLAGDFALFSNYAVREVLAMGDLLGLPEHLVHKAPADGLTGNTDEDNLGFTYEQLDAFLLDHITPNYETFRKIKERHKNSSHKMFAIRIPAPYPKRGEEDAWSGEF